MRFRLLVVALAVALLSGSDALAQGNVGIRLGFEGFVDGDLGTDVALDGGVIGGDFEVFGGYRALEGLSIEFNTGVRYHQPEWQLTEEDFDDDLGKTNLFVVPFYLTARWRILHSSDPSAWVTPYIGGGVGGYYAVFGEWETVDDDFDDDNFDETDFQNFGSQVAPGFHGLAGVEFLANRRVSLLLEFRYTYLKLNDIELQGELIPIERSVDLDLSAWQILFAVSFNLGELAGDVAAQ